MIRLLIWALLLYIGLRIASALKRSSAPPSTGLGRERGDTFATHRDPVCGIYVTEDDAVTDYHRGQRFYFCSGACRDRFRENPEYTHTNGGQ